MVNGSCGGAPLAVALLAILVGTVTACRPDPEGDPGAAQQNAYYDEKHLWPSPAPSIPVCWESPDPTFATEREWVRDAVERSWAWASLVEFSGWGTCEAKSAGVRILVEDGPDHDNDGEPDAPRSWIGAATSEMESGENAQTTMRLNFTFEKWHGCTCEPAPCANWPQVREDCIRQQAAHEFGHALGFAHEQNREESLPAACVEWFKNEYPNKPIDDGNGTTSIGPWDADSVMNYCRQVLTGKPLSALDDLSAWDSRAVRILYGGEFQIGMFRPWEGYNLGEGRWLTGDFNGDGRADHVHVTDHGYTNTWLSVGDGTFDVVDSKPWPGYATAEGQWFAGDFSGDGKTDLIHLTSHDYVHVWISKGDGRFSVSSSPFTPWSGYVLKEGTWRVGDFNGDGRTDLVHLTSHDYVHPWLSRGDGSFDVGYFQPWPGYNLQEGQWQVGDFNGDGRADLVHLTSHDYAHPWLSRSDGSFDVGYFQPWPGYNLQEGQWRVGDLDGDGKADLVHLTSHDYVHPWLSKGDGSFGVVYFQPWSGYNLKEGQWQVGDFNGDGKADLVHLTSHDYVHPWLSRGNGSFSVGVFRPWPGYNLQEGRWLSGDLDHDGRADLVHVTSHDYVHPWIAGLPPGFGYPDSGGSLLGVRQSGNDGVVTMSLGATIPAKSETTHAVHCPAGFPIPMAGGYHVAASAERLVASRPVRWDRPGAWGGFSYFSHAGWEIRVVNEDVVPHGVDLSVVCRKGKSSDYPSMVEVAAQSTVEPSSGEATTTVRCPADHPIPWTGGFNHSWSHAGYLLSTVPVAFDDPVQWSSSNALKRAGWETISRNEDSEPHASTGMIVCGEQGLVDPSDDVVVITADASAPPQNGGSAFAECPVSHPVPITGATKGLSSKTVVTVSQPLGWDDVKSWTGPDGTRARWQATADNRDSAQEHFVRAILVCRALRAGESLP